MRNNKHLRFIAQLPCICTGQMGGTQVHHALRNTLRGMGFKASDEFTVPLHYQIHDGLHRNGDETGFLEQYGIDSLAFWFGLLTGYCSNDDVEGATDFILTSVMRRKESGLFPVLSEVLNERV